MKKLVNTVVGTALAATLLAGCGAEETVPVAKETKDTEVTVPSENTESTAGVTTPETVDTTTTTTAMEETTTETVPEETTTETVPEETIPEETVAPTQAPVTEQTWPEDDCPNATAWA